MTDDEIVFWRGMNPDAVYNHPLSEDGGMYEDVGASEDVWYLANEEDLEFDADEFGFEQMMQEVSTGYEDRRDITRENVTDWRAANFTADPARAAYSALPVDDLEDYAVLGVTASTLNDSDLTFASDPYRGSDIYIPRLEPEHYDALLVPPERLEMTEGMMEESMEQVPENLVWQVETTGEEDLGKAQALTTLTRAMNLFKSDVL
jgi:hypothetical protein